MSKTVDVKSQAVMAMLLQLHDKTDDMSPVLRAIGEDVTERSKQRFVTTTGPDGVPWRPNTQATLMRYLGKRGGFSKKTGKIVAKGKALAMSKKPLHGESGDLARQIFHQVISDSVLVRSSMIYAAMQQYGGTKAQFPNLWGNIPARQFFPVTPDGKLYPQEEGLIVEQLRQYLTI
ncbi:MAG: phage virion morphogenesis protein [Burkholderiaceae bacterium]|nr:phage virion morphogenesis protein [Burkholderiaceae bacterium]